MNRRAHAKVHIDTRIWLLSHSCSRRPTNRFNSTTGSPGTVIQTQYTCQKWRPTAYRWPPSRGRLQMAT